MVEGKEMGQVGQTEHNARSAILLVDDDQIMVELLVIWLEQAGYDCSVAFDSDSALAALRSKPDIEAVICDFELGQDSGEMVLRRLRSELPELAAVIISGHTEAAVVAALGGQQAAFLQKPFEPSVLVELIELVTTP